MTLGDPVQHDGGIVAYVMLGSCGPYVEWRRGKFRARATGSLKWCKKLARMAPPQNKMWFYDCMPDCRLCGDSL